VKHEFLGDASATIDVRSAVRASIESLLAEFEICERSLMKLAREKEQRFPAIAKAAS
jgi:hypothetical protein